MKLKQPGKPKRPITLYQAEATGDYKSTAKSLAGQWKPPNVAAANPQTNQFIQSGLLKPGDMNKRIIIDASQAKTQVDELNKLIETLNAELEKATEDRDWRSVAQLTQAIDNASSARGNLMNQANKAQPQQKEGMLGGGMGMWILQQSLGQITHGIISVWDASLTAAKQRAGGDYTGAVVSQKRAREEGIGQAVGMGLGALGFLGGPVLGMMTTALGGELGRFIGGIGAKKMEENLAWSGQYKNAFQGMDSLNQLYGGAINRKSSDENSNYGIELRGRAVAAARGTGLDTEDFIEALKQSGAYGIKGETQAMNMLHTQALWSRFTGADLGTIQKIAGQAYRYNGETNTTSTAYGGLMAQGMGKGQMSEFLNAMGRIMEESISKGFIKGSEEIAGNMQMLYKLSGGSALWQGEQGAQRYSQMSMAISNATNLQSVEDVISYGAARDLLAADTTAEREAKFRRLTGGSPVTVTANANFRSSAAGGDNIMGTVQQGQKVDVLGKEGDYFRVNNNGVEGYIHKTLLDTQNFKDNGNVYTGSYVDVMQILERGLSADLLKGQWSAVRQLDGDNTAATIERFKTMYGLNYTGASQVWGMYQNAWDSEKGDWKEGFSAKEYETQIKKFQETPDYQSDSAIYKDMINSLGHLGVQIGQIEFPKTEMKALAEAMRDLEKAYRERLTPESPLPPQPTPSQELPRGASDADRTTYNDRYTAGARIPGLDPELQAVQDEFLALINQYAGGDPDKERALGHASGMPTYTRDWEAAVYNLKADPGETDDLRNDLRELTRNFKKIMEDYRPPTGSNEVSVVFPDELHVYSS